jgi:hypothetical protein
VTGERDTRLPDGLLDQYKLAVEMADRLGARRGQANTFYLAVQSALVTLAGLKGTPTEAISAAGLVLCAVWFMQLRSYRDLSAAKWKVINAMESALPSSPFTDEWAELKPDAPKKWRDRYAELGVVERVVPAVFAAIFAVLLITEAT